MPIRHQVAAAAALIAALLGLWLARAPALTSVDLEQPRLSQPAPIPADALGLTQSFRAKHNGLTSVELLAVYYGQPQDGGAVLTLRLWGPDGALVAEHTHLAFEHNAVLRLTFPPQTASADQTYRLELLGSAAAQTTVWAYHLDGYQGGDLRLGAETVPGDLRFKTTYAYLWPDLLRDSVHALAQLGGLAVPLWLVLFVPGLLVLNTLKPAAFHPSRWARWGAALALSLAVLPLAWLWATTLGLGWSRVSLGAAYAVMGALVAGSWLLATSRAVRRRRVRVQTEAFPGSRPVPERLAGWAPLQRLTRHDAAMGGLLLLSVVLRLVAVRDLALPAWVDSSHHAFIARLLSDTGRVPSSYHPLLNLDQFNYHFGVHTVLVSLDWFSALDLPRIMVLAGEVLNGLMPLAVYTGAATITGRRRAALGAAVFVGLVSFFPAYYVSWGRYSQLLGLLLLPVAMAAVWALLEAAQRRAPAPLPWPLAACAGLLAAGLLLAHYRVFIFYAVFVVVAVGVQARAGRRGLKWLAATAAVGAMLALPWLARLLTTAVLPLLGPQSGGLASTESYNEIPWRYFQGFLERGALALAGAAALWGLFRREKAVWALVLWALGIFALINVGGATRLINNNSWAISLFVPAALLLGWGAGSRAAVGAALVGRAAGASRTPAARAAGRPRGGGGGPVGGRGRRGSVCRRGRRARAGEHPEPCHCPGHRRRCAGARMGEGQHARRGRLPDQRLAVAGHKLGRP